MNPPPISHTSSFFAGCNELDHIMSASFDVAVRKQFSDISVAK